jgi:polar amino acid transport system substrate-binding protein
MARGLAAVALWLAGIALPGHAAPSASFPPLLVTTEHSPPSSMKRGEEIIGRETEKIREMLSRSGVSYKLDLLPWKRAFTMAQRDANTCVYSTTRTPEREKLFKWVGPTDEAEWVFVGRTDRKFQLRSLEDARPLRIGTYNGDARDDFLRAQGFQVDPVQNDHLNPRKLLLKRIDLWAISIRPGSNALQQFHLEGQIEPVLTFYKVKVYLACNPSVPDAMVERMNASLDTMRRDGSFARIERKYEQWAEQK